MNQIKVRELREMQRPSVGYSFSTETSYIVVASVLTKFLLQDTGQRYFIGPGDGSMPAVRIIRDDDLGRTTKLPEYTVLFGSSRNLPTSVYKPVDIEVNGGSEDTLKEFVSTCLVEES